MNPLFSGLSFLWRRERTRLASNWAAADALKEGNTQPQPGKYLRTEEILSRICLDLSLCGSVVLLRALVVVGEAATKMCNFARPVGLQLPRGM